MLGFVAVGLMTQEYAFRSATFFLLRRWGPALSRIAFGLGGLAVIVLMVERTGPHAILDALRPAWRWMPVVFFPEAMRIGSETLSTYYAYGSRRHLLPTGMLVRAHLVAYAVGNVMTAARSAGEAAKVAMLGQYAGMATATAAAAKNQSVTLIAGGLVSLPCAAGAWQLTGMSVVTVGLLVHAVALVALGLGIRLIARTRSVGARLGRYVSKFAPGLMAFHDASRDVALVPSAPMSAMLVGRLLRIAIYAILALAVGIDLSVARVLYAEGINMIVLAVGVFVPGQLGASDGAFALSAVPLGASVAAAMSIALLAHVLQLFWIGIGSLALLLWRTRIDPAQIA